MREGPPEDSEFLRRLARARSGDHRALGELLETYANFLAVLARQQTGERIRGAFAPSDLVQETLLEAVRDFDRFRGGTERELMAWLRRVLICNLTDEIKRQRTRRRDHLRQEYLEDILDHSSGLARRALDAGILSPSAHASHREEARILADALARLPEGHRELIVLRNLQRLPFAVIAERTQKSPGAVRKAWARALLRLRQILEGPS